ncbi:MAG TPA: methyltransferase domain-containing protein [Thermoanaerobaculia bacterium]|nr:methyltransferase domain-containing protein [Thermoanaerobaculia bacterium]
MPLDATAWNRLRYTVWAPIYDRVARFGPQRRRSIGLLGLLPGERVLIVGAGTGADLPYIPEGVSVLATDLTPAMLSRAASRARSGVELRVMDGQDLDLPDESFDAVILHLILAVIPDPAACLREASRVLRPGGRIAVFDKFLPDGARPNLPRRIANAATSVLFSDINRRMGEILRASEAPLRIEHDEPGLLGGFFRILLLRKG